jgi:hypothetical protein
MASIKGINCVRKRRADGSVEYRYYAWRGRGAPCIWISPHKPVRDPLPRDFVRAYEEAMSSRREVRDDFDGLAARYFDSPQFRALALPDMRRRYVDLARERIGTAPLHVIADPRFRGELIALRDSLAHSPRQADLTIQAASVVFEHARNLGLLAVNPAAGIPNLYRAPIDRRPWTAEELALFRTGAPQHVSDAFDLMRWTALRRQDAATITWAADRGTHLAWRTSKSRRAREAIIPLLPEARAFLDDLRRRNAASVTMLCGARGRPWGVASSLTQAFSRRWDALGASDGPSPHRLRNNAATAYLAAGLDERTIADAMGWTLADVEDMRRIYVDREAIVSAAVIRLQERNRN